MAQGSSRAVRLMNFVSEEQLDEAKRSRGERVEDGTAQRDRPLFEILKENKDKRDAEFNERFKHRPPKSLDDDETEFLDSLQQSKREYEQLVAEEDAQQLRSFQAAQSMIVHQTPPISTIPEEQKTTRDGIGKKKPRPLGMIIKAKPEAKKVKLDPGAVDTTSSHPPEPLPKPTSTTSQSINIAGLVSYSDESEDD